MNERFNCPVCSFVAGSEPVQDIHLKTTHPEWASAYLNELGIWCCGESFMAGTICSLAPGHPGAHGTLCQTCGEDWYDDGCSCMTACPLCGIKHPGLETEICLDCRCQSVRGREDGGWAQCILEDHHGDPPHKFPPTIKPPTQEELAEVYQSFGVEPPMQ